MSATHTTVAASLAAHAVALACLVVVPLFASPDLPMPGGRMQAFVRPEPAAIPAEAVAPPARPTASSTASTRTASSPTTVPAAAAPVTTAAAPIEAPTAIGVGEPSALMTGASSGLTASTLGSGVIGGAGSAAFDVPAPPQKPAGPIRVGGQIEAPRKLRHVAPIYPPIAAQARVTGVVLLEATIDTTGVVTSVSVLRSVPLLDAAAIEAVRQWRYAPTRLNGVAVPVLLTVTVRFAS